MLYSCQESDRIGGIRDDTRKTRKERGRHHTMMKTAEQINQQLERFLEERWKWMEQAEKELQEGNTHGLSAHKSDTLLHYVIALRWVLYDTTFPSFPEENV